MVSVKDRSCNIKHKNYTAIAHRHFPLSSLISKLAELTSSAVSLEQYKSFSFVRLQNIKKNKQNQSVYCCYGYCELTLAASHPFDANVPDGEHGGVMVDMKERNLVVLLA